MHQLRIILVVILLISAESVVPHRRHKAHHKIHIKGSHKANGTKVHGSRGQHRNVSSTPPHSSSSHPATPLIVRVPKDEELSPFDGEEIFAQIHADLEAAERQDKPKGGGGRAGGRKSVFIAVANRARVNLPRKFNWKIAGLLCLCCSIGMFGLVLFSYITHVQVKRASRRVLAIHIPANTAGAGGDDQEDIIDGGAAATIQLWNSLSVD